MSNTFVRSAAAAALLTTASLAATGCSNTSASEVASAPESASESVSQTPAQTTASKTPLEEAIDACEQEKSYYDEQMVKHAQLRSEAAEALALDQSALDANARTLYAQLSGNVNQEFVSSHPTCEYTTVSDVEDSAWEFKQLASNASSNYSSSKAIIENLMRNYG